MPFERISEGLKTKVCNLPRAAPPSPWRGEINPCLLYGNAEHCSAVDCSCGSVDLRYIRFCDVEPWGAGTLTNIIDDYLRSDGDLLSDKNFRGHLGVLLGQLPRIRYTLHADPPDADWTTLQSDRQYKGYDDDFDAWDEEIKEVPAKMDDEAFKQLVKLSEKYVAWDEEEDCEDVCAAVCGEGRRGL